ncbi:MAG TPA: type 4a pilus biogenesis protein PilO [Longimicrobiales bacterium]|nr:type 4a pilus biogenesis protein PilO [Longimicrobiales bacterium]
MALLPSDPKEQRKLLIGMLPLLALGAYWYFYHGKLTTQVEAMQSRLTTLQTQNEVARARASRGGKELEQRLAEYQTQINRLEQLVPRKEEVPGLLHELAQHAEATGVELARLTPQDEQAGPLYHRQTYDIVVYGPYHEIGRFLTDIGSLPRIITPIDLSLKDRKEKDDNGNEMLEASFQIETYILPNPPAPPAATGTK